MLLTVSLVRQVYDKFDGVLAMYHDQGLAPFKTLAMDDGVNYTHKLRALRQIAAALLIRKVAGCVQQN